MAKTTEDLKAEAQKKVGGDWIVNHASTFTPPDPLAGAYRANRVLPNGTRVELQGTTPDELAAATEAYDQLQERVVSPQQEMQRVTDMERRNADVSAAARPKTEEDLANLAVEVQPVALAEKVSTEGADAVTDEEKEKAGLTRTGRVKSGATATTVPDAATAETKANVTGVGTKTTKKGK